MSSGDLSARRNTKVHHLPPMANSPINNKKGSLSGSGGSSSTSTVPHAPSSAKNAATATAQVPRPPVNKATSTSARPNIPSTTTTTPSTVAERRLGKKSSSSVISKADRAYQEFLAKYPQYEKTSHISRLRSSDFSRLDQDKHVYLDYTGAGLHAEFQVRDHLKMLNKTTLGNPHSANPTAMAATNLVEATRADVLRFFNADSSEYDVIFTNNCSGALRIVGESYPFGNWEEESGERSMYMLPTDNHNSVNGIREFAKSKGAAVAYLPVDEELRLNSDMVEAALKKHGGSSPSSSTSPHHTPRLFAFPAQSNFSGVKHPLNLIEVAHSHGWDVLLDAAAYAPTSKIDLSILKPDFMTLSFYKMFGYPTGLGALIIKRKIMQTRLLSPMGGRPWFAGGTVEMALATGDKHWLHQDHEAFEDGTINFLGIPAISIGLKFLNEKCGGMDAISTRIQCMTSYLLDQLKNLNHGKGKNTSSSSSLPLIQFYGPSSMDSRGGTLAFNVFDCNGEVISCWEIESLANQRNISIRAGCFCNPGDSEAAFQWDVEGLMAKVPTEQLKSMTKSKLHAVVPVAGAVRVSVGVPTNFKDLYSCVNLFKSLRNMTRQQVQEMISTTSSKYTK